MLLLGGAATVEALTGVNYELASFLIPWGGEYSGIIYIYMMYIMQFVSVDEMDDREWVYIYLDATCVSNF